MYDAYSLEKLMSACGVKNVQKRAFADSAIPGFSESALEKSENGTVYKPDSFFMEARKPEKATTQPSLSIQYHTGKKGNWEGCYPDWTKAVNAAKGYADATIFEKVRQAARAVKEGQALWERDSVLFHHEEYNVPLLDALLDIAASHDNKLHVLDFGGALGSTYVQHKSRFVHLREFSWSIVEQQHVVACGRQEFSDGCLNFFPDIESALARRPVNVALFSGVAQYLDGKIFGHILSLLPQHGINEALIDRTPFRHDEERYVVQRPHSIYPGASYAMRFLSLPAFDAAMRGYGYTLRDNRNALDGAWDDCSFLMLRYSRESDNPESAPSGKAWRFSTVYFEISGICNGECPYCITGREKKPRKGRFVDADLFEAACSRMTRLGILDADSLLHLYLWGEPILHPRFAELLERIAPLPFGVALSTNASRRPEITEAFVKKVRSVRFSCSGFSQASYDRIHGFSFPTIRENMANLVRTARACGSRARFVLNFRIYQFNIDEIAPAKAFAASLGIDFSPNYAILNDWDLSMRWAAGKLDTQEERRIGCDLFNAVPASLLATAPEKYVCPQDRYLVLNELGNIMICCQTPSEEQFSVGNIMDKDVAAHMRRRQSTDVCKQCIGIGMAYVFNNSLCCPKIFT